MRQAVRELRRRLRNPKELSSAVAFVDELRKLVGADQARLSLIARDEQGQTRSWVWGTHAEESGGKRKDFPVASPSGQVGTLALSWQSATSWDEGFSHAVEQVCGELASVIIELDPRTDR